MSLNLRIGVLLVALLLLFIVLRFNTKGSIPTKYSLVWLLSVLILVLIAIVPNFLMVISKLMGFETMSNMVIGVMIFLLLLITFSLTIIVSAQQKKITLLVQEVSMLKSKNNKK